MNRTSARAVNPVPVLVALALFVTAVMALMVFSSFRWDQILRQGLLPLDQLSESRRAATVAEVHLERVLDGDPAVTAELVIASLERALAASRGLAAGRGHLAGLTVNRRPPAEIVQATEAYVRALEAMAQAMRARLASSSLTSALALRVHYRQVDVAASELESIILHEVAARHEQQQWLAALNIALAGGLALLLLHILARIEQSRAQAFTELAVNESRLRAFASGIPERSFLLDASGHYLEAYGIGTGGFAMPTEQLIGRQITDMLPQGVASECLQVIATTLASRRTSNYEYCLPIDGQEHYFEARIAPVGDTDTVIWLTWDVTARHASEQRVRDLSRLYGFLSQVSQAIVHSTTQDELFERICTCAREQGHFHDARIELFQASGSEPPQPGYPEPTIALASAYSGEVVEAWQNNKVVSLSRLQRLTGAPPWIEALTAAGMEAWVGIPLRRGQRLTGVLHLASPRLDLERADEQALFEEIRDEISLALTRFEIDQQHAAQQDHLALLAAALENSRDAVLITDLGGHIVMVNRAFSEQTGYSAAEAVGRSPRLLHSGGYPEALFIDMMNTLAHVGYWQGEVMSQSKNGMPLPHFMSIGSVPDAEGKVAHYVCVMTDLTRVKQAEEQLDALTYVDPLTGLPNRTLIWLRLEQAVAQAHQANTGVAVLVIDFNDFHTINDGLGHAVGDELLYMAAERLSRELGPNSILGRQGGDVFVAVVDNVTDSAAAGVIAQQLIDAFNEPLQLVSAVELFAQFSIGLALFPGDGTNAAELLRNAEAALSDAKRSGRKHWRSYAYHLTTAASSRLTLEARLRRALRLGLFELHYQPLVSCADGSIIGAEALVRMHPDGDGPVGPAEFIPLMEETGLVVQLGEWVQREACRQGRQWLDEGRTPGIIAVNLSSMEIHGGRVKEQLQRILEETKFPPAYLELEVTESGLMTHGSQAEHFLRDLKSLGVRLAIDDFGTGYSSLAYLKRFPVNKLKIDRSFINDIPHDAADVQLAITIIAMAKNFGLNVLAEGVEREEQWRFLAENGCDFWQGYLCSKPLPAKEFAARFLTACDDSSWAELL